MQLSRLPRGASINVDFAQWPVLQCGVSHAGRLAIINRANRCFGAGHGGGQAVFTCFCDVTVVADPRHGLVAGAVFTGALWGADARRARREFVRPASVPLEAIPSGVFPQSSHWRNVCGDAEFA
jgi:hypothetical protein